jgi:hypothetical protein
VSALLPNHLAYEYNKLERYGLFILVGLTGPARATKIISFFGDLRVLKLIGTGFAQPNKKGDPVKYKP